MYQIDTATAYTKQIITIEFWEWFVVMFLFLIFLMVSFRRKLLNIDKMPEYKYYVWGFYAKFFASISFALVSYYVYQGGDTYSYFENAMSMANLFYKNPGAYLKVMISGNTPEIRNYFDYFTGFPYDYIYNDNKTYWVVKLVSPLAIITFKSFLLSSVIIGYITYAGSWKLFQMFVRYYPMLEKQLAIGILFIPSVLFWGSGILKDPFTLMATCLFTYYYHDFFILNNRTVSGFIFMIINAILIIGIKPYIFMVLFPGLLFWIFYLKYFYKTKSTIKILIFPIILILTLGISLVFFSTMSSTFDKFAIDKALNTASVTQNDLKQDYYQGKSFDIGNFDGTPQSALKLMPAAIFAGLFRPFLIEADSIFMLLSAMENIYLLFLFIRLFFYRSVKNIFKTISSNPLILFCMIYSLFFGFMLGLTTSNFGALVRFKIPLIPFFISGLYILSYHLKNRIIEIKS